jgi:hypothetical protein
MRPPNDLPPARVRAQDLNLRAQARVAPKQRVPLLG